MYTVELETSHGVRVLGHIALQVLGELRKSASPYGMCVCHLASMPGLGPELRLFPVLSELLARSLVGIELPEKPPRDAQELVQGELAKLLAETNRKVAAASNAGETDVATLWFSYFRSVAKLDPRPRYYVKITGEGRRRLRVDGKWADAGYTL